MAATLSNRTVTGPAADHPPHTTPLARLSARTAITELLLGTAVAASLSLALQFVVAQLDIPEPGFAPEALASVGSATVLVAVVAGLMSGRRHSRWLRTAGAWVALSTFTTLALALPLQGTRFYFGGSSIDNAFRMQYMTRMASSWGLADMNYADTVPYYPAGWFWLGGRFANLIGWEGWAAYKPYALTWVAVTGVVAFTLWSLVLRRRTAFLAALATVLVGMMHGVIEPYAWPSAAWLPPLAVLTWRALRQQGRAPRALLVGIGLFVGFAAITYTLHFGFIVLLTVAMAVVAGVIRVRSGHHPWPTLKRMFLRLLPIGVVSGAVALLVWAPFLLAGGLTERSAAQHYLPEKSAFLPTPMLEFSVLGVLSLAGFGWLLWRCRDHDVAAALLAVVLGVYAWFWLSTLALLAETTLLAFRTTVILGVALAVAGVLGLAELFGYLRERFGARHGRPIVLVSCALGLIGSITLTQGAIGTALASEVTEAYEDYYPTGVTAKGHSDPDDPGAWMNELIPAIRELSGRPPQHNILLTTHYGLLSFEPYWSFQQQTPHYANPLADYPRRAAEIRQWASAQSSRELLRMLDRSRFEPPNVFVLRNQPLPESSDEASEDQQEPQPHPGKLALTLKADAFPRQPNVREYTVYFDADVFDSPAFVQREVGPYTVIALR